MNTKTTKKDGKAPKAPRIKKLPFALHIGRVSKEGKYGFTKADHADQDSVLAEATKVLVSKDPGVREVVIVCRRQSV